MRNKNEKSIKNMVLSCLCEAKLDLYSTRIILSRTAAAVAFYALRANSSRSFNIKNADKRVLGAINTRHPVSVVELKKGQTLFQYSGEKQGRWYTDNALTTPSELGISAQYIKNNRVENKQLSVYTAIENVSFFKSTAKSCQDTWSLKKHNRTVDTIGGGVQLLVSQFRKRNDKAMSPNNGLEKTKMGFWTDTCALKSAKRAQAKRILSC